MNHSLAFRLLRDTTLVTAGVLALLGFAIYSSIRLSLLNDFDTALLARGQALASTFQQNGHEIQMDFDEPQMPQYSATTRPDYFQAWLDTRQVVARSASLGQGDLSVSGLSGNEYENLSLPDGRPGRILVLKFVPRPDEDEHPPPTSGPKPVVTLAVATETTAMDNSLSHLRWLLAGSFGPAILLAGAALLAAVRQATRPLRQVARDIDHLSETDLSERIIPGPVPSELKPLVEKLNGLLGRLESAFAREKGFTADVAHELRTPLAGLQTTLDVCRSQERDPAAYVATIDKCLPIVGRMSAMVENLLLLARSESGQLIASEQSVDIPRLLDESIAQFTGAAGARGVQITCAGALSVRTDEQKLRIVLDNLLDNAVSYVNPGGSIRIRTETFGKSVCVEIANSGNQVRAEDVPNTFERFWRGDSARSEVGVHCGLGLSLCQRLMKLLNGSISVEIRDGDWFVARVILPMA